MSITAYKSAGRCIITLEIPKNAKTNINRLNVVDPQHAKFRCNKAFVKAIELKENPFFSQGSDWVESNYNHAFVYKTGEMVKVRMNNLQCIGRRTKNHSFFFSLFY